MLLTALLALQVVQAPDTVGLQQAFDSALVAVYRKHISKDLYAKAAHIFVDQRSFQKIAGIDSTAVVDWSSLFRTLGTQGTGDPAARCDGGIECPWVEADHLARKGDALTFEMVFNRPEKTASGMLVEEFTPFQIRMVRRKGTWVVTKVDVIAD